MKTNRGLGKELLMFGGSVAPSSGRMKRGACYLRLCLVSIAFVCLSRSMTYFFG